MLTQWLPMIWIYFALRKPIFFLLIQMTYFARLLPRVVTPVKRHWGWCWLFCEKIHSKLTKLNRPCIVPLNTLLSQLSFLVGLYCFCYRPPGSCTLTCLDKFMSFVSFVSSIDSACYICGDLNIHIYVPGGDG